MQRAQALVDAGVDAIVIDDSVLPHPQSLTVAQRAERAVWLGADKTGLIAKYVRGTKII